MPSKKLKQTLQAACLGLPTSTRAERVRARTVERSITSPDPCHCGIGLLTGPAARRHDRLHESPRHPVAGRDLGVSENRGP